MSTSRSGRRPLSTKPVHHGLMPATFGSAATTAGTAVVMFGLTVIGLITPVPGAKATGAIRSTTAITGSLDTGANSQTLNASVYGGIGFKPVPSKFARALRTFGR